MSNKIILHATDLDGYLKEEDKKTLSEVDTMYNRYLDNCRSISTSNDVQKKADYTSSLIQEASDIGHKLEEICEKEPQIHVYSFETPQEQHGAASRLIAKLRDPKTDHEEF